MSKNFPAVVRQNRFWFPAVFCLLAFSFFAVPFLHTRAQIEESAPTLNGFNENFDGVTAPALPSGWTSVQTSGTGISWVTTTTTPSSAPNAAFANDPAAINAAALVSPTIRIGGSSPKIIFRHNYATESTFDGGVLEIQINGGGFQDIIAAGGTFVSGGYNATISSSFQNPLGGRMAWSGTSTNYVTTEINLPVAAYRQMVQFRWLMGSDSSVASTGWWVDNAQVTNQVAGENTNAIAIPANGAAQPYPSAIQVSNLDGLVSSIEVNLENFSHAAPDDVDLMLVAPNGRKVILMSDAGGNNPVNNLSLSFNDSAANYLPDNAPIISGVYKPTNFEPGDAFPAPAPQGAPDGATLSVLNGSDPNGTWQLYLVDDGGNAGAISGGWSIAIETSINVINIPEVGAANPYPSQVVVSGLQGSITKAVVTLKNFSHTAPDDVDVLLVAPNGRRIVLMSDAGGTTEVGGINLTFDDAAANNLPDNAPLASGTYKPTDYETGDTFPAPAPQGAPTGTTLSAFYGSPANGVWKLYVVDDNGNNYGSIADSFTLDLTTSVSACAFTLAPTGQGFPTTGGSGSFTINMPQGCPWSASTNSNFVGITSSAAGEGAGVINFTVSPNMSGGRTASIVVSNGVQSQTFLIQQPSGCPFALSNTVQNVSAAGGMQTVSVTAGGTCSYQATSNVNWIQIITGAQNGDGTISFTVSPNATGTARTGTITIGAQTLTVNQASSASGRRFDFDGDGKADVSVFRPSSGVWYILNSQSNSPSAVPFGLGTDILVPADYDGDGKTDVAVFRKSADSTWYILQSATNTFRAVQFGAPVSGQAIIFDTPVPSDFDGDGRADLALFRRTDNLGEAARFLILQSSNNVTRSQSWGSAFDAPVPADYDGDGQSDFAVFRSGTWYILKSSNGNSLAIPFGVSTDKLVPADYDGDGKADVAVNRNGTWYINRSRDGFFGAAFGASSDTLVPADYDGDGKTDLAVFRSGVWYILNSGNQSVRAETWGASNDTPVPSVYNR